MNLNHPLLNIPNAFTESESKQAEPTLFLYSLHPIWAELREKTELTLFETPIRKIGGISPPNRLNYAYLYFLR
jgi:hypothetical protein